jgi:hypothetical protein
MGIAIVTPRTAMKKTHASVSGIGRGSGFNIM